MTQKKAPVKKKVVSVTKNKQTVKSSKTVRPTVSRSKVSKTKIKERMLFGRNNYIYMGAGVLLMALGFVAMSGGGMDDPNVWDESVIYGFRRITLAPILIIGGLVLEIFAIFSKA